MTMLLILVKKMISITKMIQTSNPVLFNAALDTIIIIARQFHDVIKENLAPCGSGINLQRYFFDLIGTLAHTLVSMSEIPQKKCIISRYVSKQIVDYSK